MGWGPIVAGDGFEKLIIVRTDSSDTCEFCQHLIKKEGHAEHLRPEELAITERMRKEGEMKRLSVISLVLILEGSRGKGGMTWE